MSNSKLFSFWVNVAIFFVVGWALEDPIVPALQTETYDLKINGTIVAKIQGSFEWAVRYENKILNFSLPRKDVTVNVVGNQTENETLFNLEWDQVEESGQKNKIQLIWTGKFLKYEDGSIAMVKSALHFNMKPKEKANIAVWSDMTLLTATPDKAFYCSQVKLINQTGDVSIMNNIRIQPFQIKDGEFGSPELCLNDRNTTIAPTTVSPTTPKPPSGNWTVSDNDGEYNCIHLVGDLTLHLPYEARDGANLTASVSVPAEAEVNKDASTCNYNFTLERVLNNEQILQLNFDVHEKPWVLTINFTNDTVLTHDNSRQTVTAYFVHLKYFTDEKTFPNISSEHLGKHMKVQNEVNKTSGQGALALFKSDSTHYYRCNGDEETAVANGFKIGTKNLKVEAFLPNTTEFQKEQVCPTDQRNEPTDLIPIIIGAALTALVVFVLIAYLVGRHRAKASTYETI